MLFITFLRRSVVVKRLMTNQSRSTNTQLPFLEPTGRECLSQQEVVNMYRNTILGPASPTGTFLLTALSKYSLPGALVASHQPRLIMFIGFTLL
ncbi:hypothetical protein JTE90_026249 [Oedothorax gibbosus]|uniref:Uncharacterized protein n=1 Tax=Oedothorax gibbosus TaxID=931172 RepID=A0AAV6U5Q7_9ARAC|nr:hypothetical protein JTE90_026249 [Oedothorax gibbosus]